MKSPFPGMDPYIEACGLWADFHHHLVERIYDALADAAPDRYTVRTGERSYIALVGDEGKQEHSFLPDVGIKSFHSQESAGEAPGAAIAAVGTDAGPIDMEAFVTEEFREHFVEIFEEQPERRLVTSIEVLSPSNKQRGSEGWKLYLRKRQALFLGGTHVVEIDLLRSGTRMPMRSAWPASPYVILVAREGLIRRWQAWPAFYQRPLPTIPVPLLKPDPDLAIALQPMVDAIYARSRYAHSIDYSRPLVPPLNAEEAVWLQQRLREWQTQP